MQFIYIILIKFDFRSKIFKMIKLSFFSLLFMVSATTLVYSQEIKLTNQYSRDGIDILYTKTNLYGTYYLTLSFKDEINMTKPQDRFVITGDRGTLVRVKPIFPNRQFSISYSYKYVLGRPNPKIDSSLIYLLPFKEGVTRSVDYMRDIGSAFLGMVPPHNWKSFLFISAVPDTVCAVRKGVVVSVTDLYQTDTLREYSYSREKNSIIIEHIDGTFSNYTGFEQGKIFVEPGDVVLPNQPLGVLAFYDKKREYQLRLTLYYRIETYREKEFKNELSYIDPFFFTDKGVVKLENRTTYSTLVKKEIIEKELTKSEIKRLSKLIK